MIQAGQYVTDGTAVFLVCDIRDGAQVGDIKMSPVLRKGYVKANGALLTSARTNYPRLIAFLADNPSLKAANDTAWNSNKALYVYNSSANTLRVPDATGRVLQGGSAVESKEAGVPNIIGNWSGSRSTEGDVASGAISFNNIRPRLAMSNGTAGADIIFDANKSNSIYGSSQSVQPPALTLIPQIKY